MKTLETEFVSGEGGFGATPLTYKQIIRNDKYAIYERSLNGKVRDFELIKIKVLLKGHKIFQKVLEQDEESYPGSSQWGNSGWTYNTKDQALQEFNKLSQPESTPVCKLPLKNVKTAVISGKRGRRKNANRPLVIMPKGNTFTMLDLLMVNPEYTQPTMYQEVKKFLHNKLIYVSGTKANNGKRGKPALIYRKK